MRTTIFMIFTVFGIFVSGLNSDFASVPVDFDYKCDLFSLDCTMIARK